MNKGLNYRSIVKRAISIATICALILTVMFPVSVDAASKVKKLLR